MAESVLKIGRKLRGIRYHNIYNSKKINVVGANVGEKPTEKIATDARKIKRLEDQVKNLENELQTAREQSFQAGYDEGKQRTLQEAQNRIEAVHHEMKQLEVQFNETIEQMERPLLDLAQKMAEEVIKQEISNSDETDKILLARLKKLLNEIIEQNDIIITVNPDQASLLKSTETKEKLGLIEKNTVKIIGDENLSLGEAHLETEDFFIDGSYENHTKKIRDELSKEAEG